MSPSKIQTYPHWTYFLCLEEDVVRLSRSVEFTEKNFHCYSTEIARLLMAASSEVDVLAKLVCKSISSSSQASSIGRYQAELTAAYPTIHKALTIIPRFGIELHPLSTWENPQSPPLWWSATNKVKHHRSKHFEQATLVNLLNAMAALLILVDGLINAAGERSKPHPPR
ncbi:hypothetical protein [Xanthomonas melonis]|uniref:hypothetical protein n=1 Tax=Xanthomonas melonis TaxID=56456 RepID=UPI0011B05862|nr:hypothetical protein [Xanthomonas melonis]MCC4601921.1 hypothetical protein [Xanthomonas melonis]